MCELFGFSGRKKRTLNRELAEFITHAQDNPNGWGLALFEGEESSIEKEDVRADRSRRLSERLTEPVRASMAIAHIRLATIGIDELANTHPFVGTDASSRTWTFAHNGTIFEGEALKPYIYRQRGSTDSERVLLYLIDRMNRAIEDKGGPLEAEERFHVLDEVVRENAPNNKLNLLIYDGELLYVHTNFRDSLYLREVEEGILFSTKPLRAGNGEASTHGAGVQEETIGEASIPVAMTEDNGAGAWRNVPFTTLLAYKDGRKVLEGAAHGHEYIPDEKSIQTLFLAYSGL